MAFNDQSIHLKVDASGCRAIDDYLEYRRIVGDDDNGKLFTPDEYEVYKKKVLPIREKNRIYVCWASANSGIECKMMGPETKCFCQHRYKQHKTDFEVIPSKRPIRLPCEVAGCRCKTYFYVPLNGTQPIRCVCKHYSDDHGVTGPKKCMKGSCGCNGFYSAFTCACGDPCYNHEMIIETKDERQARGKPVGHDVPYKGMGGLTGFSSLVDGYMRLDDSGTGPPPIEMLQQPPSAFDHPFLKLHSGIEKLSIDSSGAGPSQASSTVAKRSTEEEDMAYFERRYQQRLKEERQTVRAKPSTKRISAANHCEAVLAPRSSVTKSSRTTKR